MEKKYEGLGARKARFLPQILAHKPRLARGLSTPPPRGWDVSSLTREHNTVNLGRVAWGPIAPESSSLTIKPPCFSALTIVTKLTGGLSYILQSVKGQSLRIQRNQDDDSDGPVYSDVDDTPTPPPHRRALGPSVSLPAYRTDHDFYGMNDFAKHTCFLMLSTINNGNFIRYC